MSEDGIPWGSLSEPVRKQNLKNLFLTDDLQEDIEPTVQSLHAFLVPNHSQFISS